MCCWVAHHRFLLFYPRSASGRSLEGAPPSSRAAGASGTVVRGWGLAVADRAIEPSSTPLPFRAKTGHARVVGSADRGVCCVRPLCPVAG